MDLHLKGRTVLITGASQGIGAGLATAFAREGADLLLVARSAAALEAIAADASRRFGVSASVLALDLTEPGSLARVVAFGGDADILVNNAGDIPGGNLWDVDAPRWRRGWELKVFGYIDLTREIYRRMQARGAGVILNNIGSGGENFDFDYVAGSTGNAALMAFTKSLGGRSLDHGIRVAGVNPGPVMTARIVKLMRGRAQATLGDAERYGEMLARFPRGRAAHVEEIADLFVFLASDRSAYTSGVIVTVDGGLTARRSIT
ncbi:SDR family oxidoreductase [Cupriavidus sp. 30B13]|uniref:SDR family oxidoreductase n=1 Tax=Cupriavidus sp. 30B13 TaxID=3384241 RepID=UPI003B8ED7CF